MNFRFWKRWQIISSSEAAQMRALLRQFEPGDFSQIIPPANEFYIEDGVDYRRPPIVPEEILRQGISAAKLYLTETDQTYRGQFDSPGRSSTYDGQVLMPTDDPLAEWSNATRKSVLRNCHAAYHRNPVAKRAVDLTQQFAIGKGFSLSFQNQDVKKVVDEFLENPENNVKEYEKTLLRDLQIDGELFIRFYEANGQTVIVPRPPWHVVRIKTEPGFFRRAIQYELEYTVSEYADWGSAETVSEMVSAVDMLHIAINRHSYELRGRPDLFVILPWLRAYKEFMEDRARQNKWRGALIWWLKVATAAPGQIAAKLAQWKKPPTPGSVYVSSDKEELQALTNSVGASDVSEDGRQIRMMSVVGAGLAEYMLGDSENANKATANAQELPAIWKFTDAQQIMIEQVWTPILRRIIRNAVQAGVIAPEVEVEDVDGDPVLDSNEQKQTVEAERAFEISYYELQSGDPKTIAEALTLDLSNDLVSRHTAATMRGYDPNIEDKLRNREEQERRQAGARGDIITPRDIGLVQVGQEPSEDVDEPEEELPPAATEKKGSVIWPERQKRQ